MIPRTIRSNLASLRRRERLVRLVWGGCRWLALTVALLAVCVLVDYAIDRDRDTPWSVRYALFGVQAVTAAVGALGFVLWPQLRRLRDPELALWAEAHASRLHHRLITAVELNQPGAKTEGMSEELIGIVTREAEKLSRTVNFPAIADHHRLVWGAAILVPVLLLASLPVFLWPELSWALLQRQALADVDVPRKVHLESRTDPVLPINEKFQIVYRVTGPVESDTVGNVMVWPGGFDYKLKYLKALPDGAALFVADDLPPMTSDFTYTARLADGRTRTASAVHFVARPVVTRQEAWVQLPTYCGTTPTGERFELAQQGHGDVTGIPGSAVRLRIDTSKPVRRAELHLLGPANGDPDRPEDEQGPEMDRRVIPLTIGANGQDATTIFDLRPAESAYKIVVFDEYGFGNVPAPRRSVRQVPEEPPQVTLLKDYFGPDADSDVEGIPVPLGEKIRIPYAAFGPYGLGQARILYRVVKKQESGKEPEEPGPWTVLPLPEVTGRPELGKFDPKRGIFEHSGDSQVPFHAVPSDDALVLGRQVGGGRYFLLTKGLKDARGQDVTLHKGDQVEYCVEVFADRNENAGRPSARSETRVTTIVDENEWNAWIRDWLREKELLHKLDAGQRGVLGK